MSSSSDCARGAGPLTPIGQAFYLAATHAEHDLEDALARISRYALRIPDGAATARAWTVRWERNRAQVLGPLASRNAQALACRIDTIDALRFLCATRPNLSAPDAAVLEYLSDNLRSEQQVCVNDEAEYGTILAEDEAAPDLPGGIDHESGSEDEAGPARPVVPILGGPDLAVGDELVATVVGVYADDVRVTFGPREREPSGRLDSVPVHSP